MTDPMELVGRLEFYAKEAAETDCPNTARDLTEAAACIREMVEKIDMLEDELEVANLPPAPGAEA